MAIPIVPLAGLVLRYGAVAMAAYAVASAIPPGRFNQSVEDAMDTTPEGVTLRRGAGRMNGTFRWRRTIRLGRQGPGAHVDFTAFTRLKIRGLR